MKLLAVVLVAVIAVTLAFVFWNQSAPTMPITESADSVSKSSAARPSVSAIPDVVRETIPIENAEFQDALFPRVDTTQKPLAKKSIGIVGSVHLTEFESGQVLQCESGAMALTYTPMSKEETLEVLIHSGRFQFSLDTWCEADSSPLVKFKVIAMTLGDSQVFVRKTDWTVSDGEEIAIPAERRMPTLLHVVDAATREELTDVSLAKWSWWDEPLRPGEEEYVVRGARSPIPINAIIYSEEEVAGFCAQAPGYGSSQIMLDLRGGGDRVLALEPNAGELEIWWKGDSPPDMSVFRVRKACDINRAIALAQIPAGESGKANLDPVRSILAVSYNDLRQIEPFHDFDASCLLDPLAESKPAGAPPFIIRGLAAAKYWISLEAGSYTGEKPVFALAEVEVKAMERSKVTLDINARLDLRQGTTLSGTLVLGSGWDAFSGRLQAHSVYVPYLQEITRSQSSITLDTSEMVLQSDSPWTYRCKFNDVLPGRYSIVAEEYAFQRDVHVEPGGRNDFRIEIPSPADVEIALDNVQLSDSLSMTWHACAPKPLFRRDSCEAQRTSPDDPFRFRAPIGDILVILGGLPERCHLAQQRFTVSPGKNVFTLSLAREFCFRISLKDGRAFVPWNYYKYSLDAEQIGGPGKELGWTEDGCVTVTSPGRYSVRLEGLNGYRPIPLQEVLVTEDGATELVVELVRS